MAGRSESEIFLAHVTCRVLNETERAVRITTDEGSNRKSASWTKNSIWLPKSQITIDPADKPGYSNITMPEWLAIRSGLV